MSTLTSAHMRTSSRSTSHASSSVGKTLLPSPSKFRRGPPLAGLNGEWSFPATPRAGSSSGTGTREVGYGENSRGAYGGGGAHVIPQSNGRRGPPPVLSSAPGSSEGPSGVADRGGGVRRTQRTSIAYPAPHQLPPPPRSSSLHSAFLYLKRSSIGDVLYTAVFAGCCVLFFGALLGTGVQVASSPPDSDGVNLPIPPLIKHHVSLPPLPTFLPSHHIHTHPDPDELYVLPPSLSPSSSSSSSSSSNEIPADVHQPTGDTSDDLGAELMGDSPADKRLDDAHAHHHHSDSQAVFSSSDHLEEIDDHDEDIEEEGDEEVVIVVKRGGRERGKGELHIVELEEEETGFLDTSGSEFKWVTGRNRPRLIVGGRLEESTPEVGTSGRGEEEMVSGGGEERKQLQVDQQAAPMAEREETRSIPELVRRPRVDSSDSKARSDVVGGGGGEDMRARMGLVDRRSWSDEGEKGNRRIKRLIS